MFCVGRAVSNTSSTTRPLLLLVVESQEAIMSSLIQALSCLPLARPISPSLTETGRDDRDKWVVVVCIAGFCVLTLADWFVR
jgi:hypothetical protein